jgi:hypothetical protein
VGGLDPADMSRAVGLLPLLVVSWQLRVAQVVPSPPRHVR